MVAQGRIVVPHTASTTTPTGVNVNLIFAWSKRQHQYQAPVTNILDSIAKSNIFNNPRTTEALHSHEIHDVRLASESSTTGMSNSDLPFPVLLTFQVAHNESNRELVQCRTGRLPMSTSCIGNGSLDPNACFRSPIIHNVVEDVVNPCRDIVVSRNTPSYHAWPGRVDIQPPQIILMVNPADPCLTNNGTSHLFQSAVILDQHVENTDLQAPTSLVLPNSHHQLTLSTTEPGLDISEYLAGVAQEESQHDASEVSEFRSIIIACVLAQSDEVVEVDIPEPGFIEADEVDDDDDTASSSAHSRHGNHSTRIASTSTVATSVDMLDATTEQEVLKTSQIHVLADLGPSDRDTDEANDLDKLQEELEHQQSLNQGLRTQVLEREDEVAKLEKDLLRVRDERDRYEAEQDNADAQIRKLIQELADKDKQLADERAKSASAIQQLQAPQNNPSLSNQHLIPLDEARRGLEKYVHEVRRLRQMLTTTSVARDTLQQQIRNWVQRDAQQQQQVAEFSMEMSARLDQANDAISGLEQQNNHLVQLKERAEAEVRALNRNITMEYIKDPSDPANPNLVKPDEVRDLTQALKISQKQCADLTTQCRDLHQASVEKDEKNAQLRSDLDLQKARAARLLAGYGILSDKVANWIDAIPLLAQWKDDIVSVPGLKEQIDDGALHENNCVVALRDRLEEVSNLEKELAKVRRRHCRELDQANKRVAELQERNIRLDEDNTNLEAKLEEIDVLQRQLAEKANEAEEWRMQAMHQAFGDSAEIIRTAHKDEIETLSNQVKALNHRLWQYAEAYDFVSKDLNLFKYQTARRMGDVRELEAERDWYHTQVIALRDRFEVELLANPVNIPWRSGFSMLKTEEQVELVAREDKVIAGLTGIDQGRSEELMQAAKDARKAAEEKGPRGISATDIWVKFIEEFAERQEEAQAQAQATQQENGGGEE